MTWVITTKDIEILHASERKELCTIVSSVVKGEGGEDVIIMKLIKFYLQESY